MQYHRANPVGGYIVNNTGSGTLFVYASLSNGMVWRILRIQIAGIRYGIDYGKISYEIILLSLLALHFQKQKSLGYLYHFREPDGLSTIKVIRR